LRRGACARGNESAGLHDAVERTAIDHQIFDDWKRADAKRFDYDHRAIAKLPHVKLAHRARMIWAVSFAVNCKGAGAGNPFTAIRVERDGFPPAPNQIFVQNIEHLEKRSVRRNVAHVVIDEFAGGLRVLLTPNFQSKIHGITSS